MGWSDRFRRALRDGRSAVRHRIRSVQVQSLQQGEPWQISDDDGGALGVSIAGGKSSGPRLQIGKWTSTLGGFSVDLVGDPTRLLEVLWRGQIVVHEVAFKDTAWEPVESGKVHSFAGGPGRYRLEVQDLTGALRTRYTGNTAELALFSGALTNAEDEDGLTPDRRGFVNPAGSYTSGDTTLVSGNADSEYQFVGDAGGSRLVCVNPLNGNRRFYLKYTGLSGTLLQTLTGVTGTDEYGTTNRNASGSTTVQTVPFVEDHPIDIIRRILVSTGYSWDTTTATQNGVWDLLPATWGYALPNKLLDHDDMDFWKPLLAPSSGSAAWTLLTEYEQEDGLEYLSKWLGRGGLFLTMRQGRLTVRGCTDPDGTGQAQGSEAISFGTLRGEDLVPGSIRWDAWGGGDGNEYREVRVYTSTSSSATSDPVRSRPASDTFAVELQDTIWSNQSAHQALIRARMAPWTLTLPERLTCATHNPLARGLACGDIVPLKVPHFGGRSEGTGGYSGRIGMVTAVDPDWWTFRPTRLTFSVPPPVWWRS